MAPINTGFAARLHDRQLRKVTIGRNVHAAKTKICSF